jgi:hypothetical protein
MNGARNRKAESNRLKSPLSLGFVDQYQSLSGAISPERAAFLGKVMGGSKRPVEQISPNELSYCQADNDMLKGDLSNRIKINKILGSATVETSKRAPINGQYDSIISNPLKTGRGSGFKVGQFFKKDRINKIINEVDMTQRLPNIIDRGLSYQSFPDIMGRRNDTSLLIKENRSIKDGLKAKHSAQMSARVGHGVNTPLFERVSNERTGQGLAIVSNKTEVGAEKKDFFMKKTEI